MEKMIIKYEGTDIADTITFTKTDCEKIERLSKAWNMTKIDVVRTALNQEIKMLDEILS